MNVIVPPTPILFVEVPTRLLEGNYCYMRLYRWDPSSTGLVASLSITCTTDQVNTQQEGGHPGKRAL